MSRDITIALAIIDILTRIGSPSTPSQIYQAIVENELYDFKAKDPKAIVRSTIRRHCEDIEFVSARKTKYFYLTADKKYGLITWRKEPEGKKATKPSKLEGAAQELREAYKKYDRLFKENLRKQLDALGPYEFENFARNFLSEFGFDKMEVTKKSRDGGIDGHGQVKIGFTTFSVSFECKRWRKKPVGPDVVSKLRGRIHGLYGQGYLFTTNRFTAEAKKEALRSGTTKIALIDGKGIVELMLKKGIGVERQDAFPTFDSAIDLLLSPDD